MSSWALPLTHRSAWRTTQPRKWIAVCNMLFPYVSMICGELALSLKVWTLGHMVLKKKLRFFHLKRKELIFPSRDLNLPGVQKIRKQIRRLQGHYTCIIIIIIMSFLNQSCGWGICLMIFDDGCTGWILTWEAKASSGARRNLPRWAGWKCLGSLCT